MQVKTPQTINSKSAGPRVIQLDLVLSQANTARIERRLWPFFGLWYNVPKNKGCESLIPLRDQIPSQRPPVMTLILIGINLYVFYQSNLQGILVTEEIFARYALIPGQFDLSRPFASITPLITSIFLHGNLAHLISNMWALWLFGDNVEDRMGVINFLVFYLLCGIAAGLSHIYVYPNSLVPTIGASGAVAGIMGAYFILYPQARVLTLVPIFIFPWFVDIPAFVYLGFWLLVQIMGGTSALAGGAVQIAFWAHVGGFAAGMLLHRLFLIEETSP